MMTPQTCPPADASVVYAVQAHGNMVKIGVTADLPGRMRTLAAVSPVPLVLLGTRPGGIALERALHREFKAYRSHGEWFILDHQARETLLDRLAGEPRIIPLPKAGRRQMLSYQRRGRRRRD